MNRCFWVSNRAFINMTCTIGTPSTVEDIAIIAMQSDLSPDDIVSS